MAHYHNRTNKILNMAVQKDAIIDNNLEISKGEKPNNQEKKVYANLETIQNIYILDIPEVTSQISQNIPVATNDVPLTSNITNDLEGCDLGDLSLSMLDCDLDNIEIESISRDLNVPILDVNEQLINQNQAEKDEQTEASESEIRKDPSYTIESTSSDTEESLDDYVVIGENKRKRNKRHNVNETKWRTNENKRKREMGEEYFGKRKINGTWNYEIPRDERRLEAPCNCKMSLKNKTLQCIKFTETEREQIFKNFWSNMTWEQRKIFVDLLVIKLETVRHRNRKQSESSRRNFSWNYYLKNSKGEKLRVCKKMFLSTLGLKERTVIDWKAEKGINGNETDECRNSDNEGNNKEKVVENRKTVLKEFFRDLTKVESHYCRAKTTKLYLEPNWESKSALYKFYKSWSNEKNVKPVSIALFLHVFEDMNLSLFKPKKDECDQCVGYRVKNISEEDYALHQIKKNESREAKNLDKTSNNKVFCMDMQGVLLSPKSNTSALYFKMKLMIHNFTIYDMKSNKGYCFIWHEAAGGVTSNNYSSIICFFIKHFVFSEIENGQNIILYSDGCTSQNRNVTLSNALLNICLEHKVTIEQKFLEKGHTQMEADAMHSLIERKLRKSVINVPADYVEVCLRARENPNPFIVKYLNYDFFKDFSSVKLLTSIRPGRKVGEPVVTDLRALKYTPNGDVFYKIRHTDDYIPLYNRNVPKNKDYFVTYDSLPQLYKKPLAIKKEKWDHLQQLKKSIPNDYHYFYDGLPYQ